MDFALNEQQQALRETARRFARDRIAPAAAGYDQSGEFPREIIAEASELGFLSTCIPSEYGGIALPLLTPPLLLKLILSATGPIFLQQWIRPLLWCAKSITPQ